MSVATGRPELQADAPRIVTRPYSDPVEVVDVVVNRDGSGYVSLSGGAYLNFEAAPPHVKGMLMRRKVTITSQTVLVGEGPGATLVAYRDSPKRIRFAPAFGARR